MLTDTKLRQTKGQEKPYKMPDRDGLYVMVLPSGTLTFRYDYRIHDRRETLTIGKYGPAGITLLQARDALNAAKRLLAQGISPAQEKRRGKDKQAAVKTFAEWAKAWLSGYAMADSTRDMRNGTLTRELLPVWGKRLLSEISSDDLRDLTDKIVARGAPSTAVHAREVVMQVFDWAIGRGVELPNPADKVRPSSIAKFKPRDRALSGEEIGIFFRQLEKSQTNPIIRMAILLILLTMVRKGEMLNAEREEIKWTDNVWQIPASRMKAGRVHNIYLSHQMNEIMMALSVCAGSSPFLLPSRYDLQKTMSNNTLNVAIDRTVLSAQEAGLPLESFSVHDLRRTASTHLHEAGFNSDWIEKCLAHEQRGVRAVYNKAEYAQPRAEMLQWWSDMSISVQ